MVGDDDPLHPGLHGLDSIIRSEDSLEDDGQLRVPLEPLNVLPTERLIEERGHVVVDAGAAAVALGLGLEVAQADEVGHAEVRRELP